MALVRNSGTGEIRIVDDPSGLLAEGWTPASPEQADSYAKQLDFGTLGQTAQAVGESALRGATLGIARGFGEDADIQARSDVLEQEHPVLDFAADVLPQVALGAATGGLAGLATGAGRAAAGEAVAAGGGLLRAGLAAGRAGGAVALAGESAAAGAVGSAQSAYERGQYLGENPGLDAENALIFGGLNFGLGTAAHALFGDAAKAAKQSSRFADTGAAAVTEGAEKASIDDVIKVAEAKAAAEAAPAPAGAPVPEQVALTPAEQVDELSSQFGAATGLPTNGTAPVLGEDLGQQVAPVSLAGKSLEDLNSLPITEGDDLARVEALKADPGFSSSGRVATNDGAGGITLIDDAGELMLRDGRHRLAAAQQLGREDIFGRYLSGETGEVLYEGMIPLRVPGAEKAAQRVAERAAVEDGLDRALSKASRSEADDVVQRAVGEKAPTPEADSFGRQRRLYQNREAIQGAMVREMQRDLTDVVSDLPAIARGGKATDVARHVSGDLSSQRVVADGVAEEAATLAGQLRGEARAYAAEQGKRGMQYAVPGQKQLVMALTDSAKEIARADSGKAMFEAIDGFKQLLQDHKMSFEAGAQNSLNPKAFQDLIPRVATLASQTRAALEDAAVWGKAGDMQKAYNAVLHDQLIPSMKVFEESVLKRTSKDYDSLWKMEGWENKISSLLKGDDLGRTRHVNAVLDGLDQLAAVRSQYGDNVVGARMAERVAKIRRTLGLADEVRDASGRMGALGTIAGSAPLVGGIAREFVTGDMANAFRRLSGAVDRGIDRGVDDWISSSRLRGEGGLLGKTAGKAARLVTGSGEDSAIAQIARRNGISQGLARFMGQDKSPQAAFERARASLQSDEQFFQSMGQDYQSLQQQAPETYMMLAGQAANARAWLKEKMPPNVSVSVMNPMGYPPARESIEDWSVIWNAVKQPMGVVRNLRSARIQELQTLERVYPRLYERTQQRVLEKVGTANATGKPLDDALLVRLQLMFPDIDGSTPAFSRAATQLANDWNASQEQPAPVGQPPKGASPTTPGSVQSTAAHGVTFGTGF